MTTGFSSTVFFTVSSRRAPNDEEEEGVEEEDIDCTDRALSLRVRLLLRWKSSEERRIMGYVTEEIEARPRPGELVGLGHRYMADLMRLELAAIMRFELAAMAPPLRRQYESQDATGPKIFKLYCSLQNLPNFCILVRRRSSS
ncbi:hypothetical protein HPP92_011693 [Vanilla planifolia]|uniref:Uncharacterized protein n=1 Tax=Vanilla planifolia TaxID=51239 RepID=A0A835V218_VANPL|nr:hypothetical protein HPP92_011693 [Vanilla planifolia]